MFGVQYHRGNTLMAALLHRYPRYSRHRQGWQASKIPPVSARLEIAHARAHTESFSLDSVVINRSKTGLGGSTAHWCFSLRHAVQSRPAFGTSPVANATVGASNLFGHELVVPPHCATRRWTMHENPIFRMSASSRTGCGATGWRMSCPFCTWKTRKLAFFLFPCQFGTMFASVSIPQSPKRHRSVGD